MSSTLPFIELDPAAIDRDTARALDASTARVFGAVVISLDARRAVVAFARPTDRAIETVAAMLGVEVQPLAAERGHVETVRTLIEAGVDVDHVNNLGWTALMEAVILGDGGPRHADIVRLLVEAGANVGLADRDGVTPLQHARRRGYAGIARLLEDAGAR